MAFRALLLPSLFFLLLGGAAPAVALDDDGCCDAPAADGSVSLIQTSTEVKKVRAAAAPSEKAKPSEPLRREQQSPLAEAIDQQSEGPLEKAVEQENQNEGPLEKVLDPFVESPVEKAEEAVDEQQAQQQEQQQQEQKQEQQQEEKQEQQAETIQPEQEAPQEVPEPTQAPVESPAAPASISMPAAAAEFLAMMLFVIIGCGSAMGIAKVEGYAWVLQVSLTFGFAITVLAYTIGHFSGGHINCAVTFGLVLAGQVSVKQGIANFIAQLAGSFCGAFVLTLLYPEDKDLTGNLASNGVGEGWTQLGALVGEIIGTFLLMFVVLETAVNPATFENREMACLAIGLAVFLAHSVLIPIDGCSINPTRSIGPAIVAKSRSKGGETFKDMWVFWVGPLVGAAIAAGVYSGMNKMS